MREIKKVYNATRHNHFGYKHEWEQKGIEFIPNYSSHSIPIDIEEGATEVRKKALEIVNDAIGFGADAILISGISSLMIFIAIEAINNRISIIEPVFSGRDRNILIFSGYRDLTDEIITAFFEKDF